MIIKKMMNKIIKLVFLFCFMCSLLACSQSDEVTPTGFPANEVQRVSVYYCETLFYESGDAIEELPKTAKSVGSILENRVDQYPKEDLHAAHVEVGTEVYKDETEDILYVNMYGTWKIFKVLQF